MLQIKKKAKVTFNLLKLIQVNNVPSAKGHLEREKNKYFTASSVQSSVRVSSSKYFRRLTNKFVIEEHDSIKDTVALFK